VVPATALAAEIRPCAQAGSFLYGLAALFERPLAIISFCYTVAECTNVAVALVIARAASRIASEISN